MARTVEAHRRQQARKKARREEKENVGEWQVWRRCGLCEQMYVANNYHDKKTRIKRWHGVEVCAFCINRVVKWMPRVMELGIVKFTKAHRP